MTNSTTNIDSDFKWVFRGGPLDGEEKEFREEPPIIWTVNKWIPDIRNPQINKPVIGYYVRIVKFKAFAWKGWTD